MIVTQICQLTLIKALCQELKGHVYIAQTSGVLQISELASNTLLCGTVQFDTVILAWVSEAPQTAS